MEFDPVSYLMGQALGKESGGSGIKVRTLPISNGYFRFNGSSSDLYCLNSEKIRLLKIGINFGEFDQTIHTFQAFYAGVSVSPQPFDYVSLGGVDEYNSECVAWVQQNGQEWELESVQNVYTGEILSNAVMVTAEIYEADLEMPDSNITSKTITENGTYNASADDADGYSPVVVAVSGIEPVLPAEYQEVEYIDFTPHCGYEVTIPTLFLLEAKISPDTIQESTDSCAFGYRVSTPASTDFEVRVRNGAAEFWTRGGTADNNVSVPCSPGDVVVVRGFAYNFKTTAFIGRYATYGPTAYFGFDGKIYYIKGWNYNRELSFKFVPCYRKSDDTPGFYDVVSDVFYSTLNTVGGGSIALGPDVN